MLIREIFDTNIEEKIEPVVRVAERQDAAKLAAEIGSYVVTPDIEKYLDDFLEHYTDTFQIPTTEIGIWISGYFGSGKSYLAKMAALLAENPTLVGVSAAERFVSRISADAPRRASLERSLFRLDQSDTIVLGFNINTAVDDKTTPLPHVLLSQYYQSKGYCSNFIYARVIEAEMDKLGKLDELHKAAERLANKEWAKIQNNPTFYSNALNQATSEVAPHLFPSPLDVAQALQNAGRGELYNVQFLVRTIMDDLIELPKRTGKTTRFLFVLDEMGHWIADDKQRLAHLQALIEEAGDKGQGKIWVIVTTHEDMAAVYANAGALKADFKQVEGRFFSKPSLTTENIELVLEDRLFKKSFAGKQEVLITYRANPGILRDLGELKNSSQKLPPCTEDKFTSVYPFLPYQIHLIPEIVKSLRSAGGRGEQLSGSTRTLLAISQDILRAGRRGYLDDAVGALVSFDEVYSNLVAEGEITPDVRREMNRIEDVVPKANSLTRRVAEVLYLVRELRYIPRTIDNIARLLVEYTDDDLPTLISRVQPELDKLQKARLVARIGEEYEFLTGERRTFEEEVAGEMVGLKLQDLESGLEELADKNILGFTTVPYHGHEFSARIFFDGKPVSRDGHVNIRVHSPLEAFRTQIADIEDASLRQDEQESIFVLCSRIRGFDDDLKYFLAMKAIVDSWKSDPHRSDEARALATQREANDLNTLRDKVLDKIQIGLRQASVVFRGSSRPVMPKAGQSASDALRDVLATFWPTLYTRYDKVPVQIVREQQGILNVLDGKEDAADVKKLNLFDKSGQVNVNAPLLDALRVHLSLRQSQKQRVLGKDLIDEFTRPPYGWHQGVIRVGVAAMVRAGAVRVLINKRPHTNPADKQLQDAIRVSGHFNKVELVLEETDLDPDVLVSVRKILIRLTRKRKIDETPAALSAEAGIFATDLLLKAEKVRHWHQTTYLPLSVDFQEGQEALERIQALNNPMHRVREVNEQGDQLKTYQRAIQNDAGFVDKYGKAYLDTRRLAEFLSSIYLRLPTDGAIVTFRKNWRTAMDQATVTDMETWKGVQNDKAAAEVELQQTLTNWRDDARAQAQNALDELPQLVAKYNIADDEVKLHDVVVQLQAFIDELDITTENSYLANAQERSKRYVRELQARLETLRPTKDPDPGITRVMLRLADFAPEGRVKNLEQWLKLDKAARQVLADGNEVELE